MGDLTTLATAKEWLAITGTADDALLTRLVSAVSVAAQSYMGRVIASASYTVTRNGTGKTKLALPDSPIQSVTSVTVDGTPILPRVNNCGDGYTFDSLLVYLVGSCFTIGVQNVVVVYAGGYASTPLDLEQAVVDIVGYKYRQKSRIGEGSKILQGETVSFLRDVPPDTMRALDQYRRVVQA